MTRSRLLPSKGATVRKRMVGVLLVGLVVAGCGSSGGSPEVGGPPPQPAPKPPESARKGPVKATDIPDKCGIISQQQQQQIGFTKPPRERTSNGKPGCQYQAGELGHPGWGAFVAVSNQSSFDKQVKMYGSNAKKIEVAGYPAIEIRDKTGCIVDTDVADDGFSIANLRETSMTNSGLDLCQQAQKVTESALQNVPNA